jgi:hypothetical protein
MSQGPVLSFRSDISLVETLEGIKLQSPWGKLSLTALTPALLPVVRSDGG